MSILYRWLICLLAIFSFRALADNASTNNNLLVISACASPTDEIICWPWVQVNQDSFGLGGGEDGLFVSEEGFEVFVFSNQLYLGMEADNSLGARLWRTRSGVQVPNGQADWEEVAADSNGYPFGVQLIEQNDHIDSLAEFEGWLYTSTANQGSSQYGTRLFRSQTGNPGSWEDAIPALGAGFGSILNTNFKDMQVFEGWLCGGTQNAVTGAQVWCTEVGTTWTQKNRSGFGATGNDPQNRQIWAGTIFSGGLYFGLENNGTDLQDPQDNSAKVFRTANLEGTPEWIETYSGPPGSIRADILGELDGDIYITIQNNLGIQILRSSTGNTGSWIQVNTSGMDGNQNNLKAVVDGASIHKGYLYVSVSNLIEGFELWRTDGTLAGGGPLVNWEQVGTNGLVDTNNVQAELVNFNDYLYVWTTNYSTGQEVLRSTCFHEDELLQSFFPFISVDR